MKKISLLMSIIAVLLLAACSGKSSKGDKDDEEEETTESFDMEQLQDLFKSALSNCKDWTADDGLEFHKEKAQTYIDFYESDPTPEQWLELRKMEQECMGKMVDRMDVQNMGDWPYLQLDGFSLDDDAEELDAKLKKVYTKWKKAHADELAEVVTVEVASDEEEQEWDEVLPDVPATADSIANDERFTDSGDDEILANDDSFTETTDSEDDEIYNIVEQMPRFSGDLNQWIKENLEYPDEARSNGKEGRVICQFVIEKNGYVSTATVLRSDDPVFNDAALRLINFMPRWIPGRQNGKVVRTRYTLPIKFTLGE